MAFPRKVGSRQPHVAVQHQNGRLTWIVVLGEPRSSDHADDRLTQHLLMTAEYGVGGVATAGRPSQRNLLAGESIKRNLLHVMSVPVCARTRERPTHSPSAERYAGLNCINLPDPIIVAPQHGDIGRSWPCTQDGLDQKSKARPCLVLQTEVYRTRFQSPGTNAAPASPTTAWTRLRHWQLQQAIRDTVEVSNYLRNRLGQDKKI